MFTSYKIRFISLLLILASCQNEEKADVKNPLQTVLASKNPKIKRVMDNIEQHEVQIIFTQIEQKKDSIFFKDHKFQVDATQYFYPASTVKFPIALLALSKLNNFKNLNRNTRFYVEGDSLETTFAKEIEKLFAVSDNAANNRLFEFLGQDYINTTLSGILKNPVRISHRLSTPNSDEITTTPLVIYQNDSTTTLLPRSINTTAQPLTLKGIKKGVAHIEEDEIVQSPFDFSLKNYYPIEAQHEFLKKVLFPDMYTKDEKLNLSKEQLHFVHKTMSAVPKQFGYNPDHYYDGYCKFFMYGDTKDHIPEHIKIYNKVGDAYGTLTDCAYIHDTKNNIAFLLTATILVNKNGIFNDNNYEYDELGTPFLAALGRGLYDYELARKNASR